MAGRDPRADILDNNPFSNVKPKIQRIHSSTSDDGTIHINLGGARTSFSNKPKVKNDTSIWHFSDIEKSNLKLATAAFTLALGFMVVRGFGGISSLGFNTWILTLLLSMPVMLLAVGPAFLLHEIAHYETYIKYQNTVKPHGIEWKNNFRLLMLPFLNNYIFPDEILNNLINYIKNPKASTESDFNLIMSLKKYDFNINSNFIFELKEGDFFKIENGKKYKFIRKRIKRIECIEVESGRKYLFSPQVEVYLT